MKNRRVQLISVLIAGLMVLSVAGCAPQSVDGSDGKPLDTITVSGVGESRADPDMASLNVGVNVANLSISDAVAESNDTVAAITEAIKGLGVEEADIQTTNFNIYPEDVYDQNSGQPTGDKRYHVDSTVQINVRSIDNVSKILEAAIEQGANNIYGLSFGIQDTSQMAEEARTAALTNARERADQIASELGVTLGQVHSVAENSGGPVYPMFQGASMGMGGGGGAPPVSEGQMTVSVSVSVTYGINR
ncbi:MAG: SIMPL domain-containing protein [Anaerolineales bacterium]